METREIGKIGEIHIDVFNTESGTQTQLSSSGLNLAEVVYFIECAKMDIITQKPEKYYIEHGDVVEILEGDNKGVNCVVEISAVQGTDEEYEIHYPLSDSSGYVARFNKTTRERISGYLPNVKLIKKHE
jgi:hypothetical protein